MSDSDNVTHIHSSDGLTFPMVMAWLCGRLGKRGACVESVAIKSNKEDYETNAMLVKSIVEGNMATQRPNSGYKTYTRSTTMPNGSRRTSTLFQIGNGSSIEIFMTEESAPTQ